jgi:hypothetical protein
MRPQCHRRRSGLWWATTDKDTSPAIIATVWKRITRLQHDHGLPQYSVAVFEGARGLHAHIVFIGTSDMARRLKGSTVFGSIIKVAPVTNADGLVRKYLAKERTPQAGYGRNHTRSHSWIPSARRWWRPRSAVRGSRT